MSRYATEYLYNSFGEIGMSNSFFFLKAEKNEVNSAFLDQVERFSKDTSTQIFVLHSPLADSKYAYPYKDAFILLSPKHKITFINFGDSEGDFEEYVEDVVEDLGAISDKYSRAS